MRFLPSLPLEGGMRPFLAVEAQAIDRTHRIGQSRTVIAYRMLALGTIEEKIWELQTRKASLAKEVLGEDGFAKALTRGDLEYLLDAPAGASPRGPGVPGRRGGPP